MELMTQLRLLWLGAWVVLAVLMLGTAAALSWVLNRRARRGAVADSRSGETPGLAFRRFVGEGKLGEGQLR